MTDKHNKQENLCTSSERTQKCPYCGTSDMLPVSPIFASSIFDVDFACGTRMHINKTHCVQGLECVIRQQARSELSKEIAEKLETVRSTIALLVSMVDSCEAHSTRSCEAVISAINAIDSIKELQDNG